MAAPWRRQALRLAWMTTAWNALEVLVAVGLGVHAHSLALLAFGLDSLVEIAATLVLIAHLGGRVPGPVAHGGRALRRIAGAFWLLGAYLLVAGGRSLASHEMPGRAPAGIGFLAATAVVMFVLAARKRRLATESGDGPLAHEAIMTRLDGWLSVGVLGALVVDAGLGWWWADPVAALVIAAMAAREGVEAWRDAAPGGGTMSP